MVVAPSGYVNNKTSSEAKTCAWKSQVPRMRRKFHEIAAYTHLGDAKAGAWRSSAAWRRRGTARIGRYKTKRLCPS